MQLDLIKNGANTTDVGYISIIVYPVTFKFLIAPFLDKYYIPSVGRRKTYVVLSLVLLIITYSILYFYINSLVQNLQVLTLTVVFFIAIIFITFLNITLDAWPISLLSKQNLPYSATWMTLGNGIGGSISYNFYLFLSSASFCRTYFGTQEAIMTPQSIMMVTVVFMTIILIGIWSFVDEKSQKEQPMLTFEEIYAIAKGVFS